MWGGNRQSTCQNKLTCAAWIVNRWWEKTTSSRHASSYWHKRYHADDLMQLLEQNIGNTGIVCNITKGVAHTKWSLFSAVMCVFLVYLWKQIKKDCFVCAVVFGNSLYPAWPEFRWQWRDAYSMDDWSLEAHTLFNGRLEFRSPHLIQWTTVVFFLNTMRVTLSVRGPSLYVRIWRL